MQKVLNVLSVDFEDYYHAEIFSKHAKYSEWESYPSRLEANIEKTLRILGDTRATFFVLGWVASHFPEVVKKVHRAGHEIACHTYDHKLIYKQSRREFRTSIRKSKRILEDLIGEDVIGFRAPTFSIVEKTLWALDILMEEGYRYDSSIFPVLHDRYGIPDAERFPFKISKGGREIIEFPLSTVSFKWGNFPISGGGYMRILPYYCIKRGISAVNGDNKPVVFYFHPWELDAEQPRIPVGFLSGMRHYYNLDKTEKKIGRLLKDFSFDSFRNVLKEKFDVVLQKEDKFFSAAGISSSVCHLAEF